MSNKHLSAVRERAIANEIPRDSSLRFLLKVLADYADDEGTAFPSVGVIAAEMGLDPKSVRRLITKAVDAGLLAADRRGGRHRASTYRILKPGHGRPPFSAGKPDTGVPVSHRKEDIGDRQTRTPASQKADTGVRPTQGTTTRTTTRPPSIPPFDDVDDIELLVHDLNAPRAATPAQIRAIVSFSRHVGRDRTIAVLEKWLAEPVDDRYGGALEQLRTEADDAVDHGRRARREARRRSTGKYAYMNAYVDEASG